MKKLVAVLLLSLVMFSGCAWSAKTAGLKSYGADHSIQLYSGGTLVREWTSNGKVAGEQNTDGYYFQDKETGLLVRVTGDLVITPIE